MLRRANFLTGEMEYDASDPEGYRSGAIRVSKLIGAEAMSVRVFEVPGGESLCPYHYEYEEEWLIVLDGTVLVRTPDGEEPLDAGEIVHFPAGPAGAHKVRNGGDAPARMIMFSSAREPSVAVYPDSDKIGVFITGNDADTVMLHRADGAVDYYDGET
jgi:uncharacterized cupin superfamily protein